mmetsp:Transcript_28958/g.49468  ORF Transcript_28958/g.49468 Transcript_28958/m.49468 type:complete len:283 (+) Transcript_28958:308-1156(+)
MAAVAAATAAVAASAAHVETTVAGTTTAVATMTAATTGTVATTGTAVTTAIVTATGTATATAATTATVTAVAATTPIRTTTTVASASRRRRTGARTRRTRTARRRRRSARASMTMTAMTSMTRRKRSQAAGTPLTTNATDRRNAMTTATATATVTVTVTERTWLGRCRRLNERDESCCRRIGLDPSHVSGGVVGRVAVCARCAACGCGWRPGEHAATLLATHMPPKNQPLGGCRFGPARLQLPSVHTRNTSCFNSCAREAAARASDRLRTTRRLYTVAYAVS